MNKDTNLRSIVKGISWRLVATTTTIIIVYFFFNRLDLAIAAGLVETILKIGLYWAHERAWFKIKWGRKKIDSFNIYFNSVFQLEKSIILDKVYARFLNLDIPIERITENEINYIIPDIQNMKEDKQRDFERIGHFIGKLQNNSISTVLSIPGGNEEYQEKIEKILKNNIFVYIINSAKKDIHLINVQNKKNIKHEIIIDLSKKSENEAVEIIFEYVKNKVLKIGMD